MKTITINFPGGSLNDVKKQFSGLWYPSNIWFADSGFAKEIVPKGTWTVQLEPVKGSFSKTWAVQQALIPKDAVVPPAAVFAYALCQYREENGEHALEEYQYLRCSDLDSDGDHVYVGCFDAGGLRVYGNWDSARSSNLGLAVAWKGALNVGRLEALEAFESSDLELRLEKVEKILARHNLV